MTAHDSAPLLRVHELSAHFDIDAGLLKAVDNVSFELQKGGVLGVVGESGSGKSVTALSIMGLLPAPRGFVAGGEIWFDGQDLVRAGEPALRSVRGNRIAMIFQDPMTSLNPYLSVERQLSEVLELHRGLSRAAARTRAIAALERVGIPDAARRIDSYPHEFSGGMRQRVMIAMALLCEPALLIADEPTTALDVTIQAQVLDLIGELRRDIGTSVILITHDLGVVAGMADEVAVMYAGRIVEHAPAERLFADPRHPYTQGLLASVPRITGPRRSKLTSIRGLPPDLSNLPSGCPFRVRCDRAQPHCAQSYPPPVQLRADHYARCFEVSA
jgi:oligopeptide transport system ATP-binding protein